MRFLKWLIILLFFAFLFLLGYGNSLGLFDTMVMFKFELKGLLPGLFASSYQPTLYQTPVIIVALFSFFGGALLFALFEIRTILRQRRIIRRKNRRIEQLEDELIRLRGEPQEADDLRSDADQTYDD
ncbi:MAG: lipopolysaccharide assembly protein LapA domain-containing protein [Candidatus Alcyoniella australis]|nr:lipopolysaccharide assembly protein LapA domain-containing protein [Candidatus Alcyoniella australis]